MKQPSRKIIALLAFILFSVRGRAETQPATENDGSNSVIEKIQAKLKSQPELASFIPNMEKTQLEDLIQQEMSDEDFAAVQSLLAGLASEDVQIEVVTHKNMVLSTQEYNGR
jgi:hypothetical protein